MKQCQQNQYYIGEVKGGKIMKFVDRKDKIRCKSNVLADADRNDSARRAMRKDAK